MKTRTRIAIGSVAAAAVMVGGGVALAGHTNTIVGAHLDGRNEVREDAKSRAIVGDPNGTGEGYVFAIDPDRAANGALVRDNTDTLCYLLQVEGIAELEQGPGGGRAAHIHKGAEAVNGPVVANLAWPQDGDAADCLVAGEVTPNPTDPSKAVPKFTPPAGQTERQLIANILANPQNYYFNVHNAEYPGGAIRGQLRSHG